MIKTGESERNHCIDLLRGLCLFCIIFNHTCFNSGDSYVSPDFAKFSMLIDVPALFFVSGITYCYIQRNILVSSLLKLSLSFTLVAILINFADRSLSVERVMMPLFWQNLILPKEFHCLQVSYWFVPLYVSVLVLATVILRKIKAVYPLILIGCLMAYFLNFFAGMSFPNVYILGVMGQQVYFYLAMFLLGYFFKEKIWPSKRKNLYALLFFLGGLIVYICLYFWEGNFVFDIMMNKFPPRLPYVAFSFLSIGGFMWYYKPERKCKILEHIGKNALFYYIGQGIGASLLYFVVDYINMTVFIKLPLMFVINLCITALSAEILKFMYESIGTVYRRAVQRFS